MRIEIRFKDDVAIMALSGKFVAGGDGPFLRQKVKDLIDAGATKLIVNFEGVPYIDSTGLGFLAGSRVTAQNSGVKMVLSNVNSHVQRVLDSTHLKEFFDLVKDEETAVSQLNSADGAGAEPAKAGRKKKPAAPAE